MLQLAQYPATDFATIMHRHRSLLQARPPHAGPVLVEDTDPLLTSVRHSCLTGTPCTLPDLPDRADLYRAATPRAFRVPTWSR